MKNLDALKEQGDVIWNIANLLRGPYRPPQYRRVMIPLPVGIALPLPLDYESKKNKGNTSRRARWRKSRLTSWGWKKTSWRCSGKSRRE